MKEICRSKFLALLNVLAFAVLLVAGLAAARERECVGSFTLTSETRWGTAILPPGRYTFELDATKDLINVRSQTGKVVMVMSQTHDRDTRLQSSALVLVSRGGRASVRALRLAPLKAVFLYPVPKERSENVARTPLLIQGVPVMATGD